MKFIFPKFLLIVVVFLFFGVPHPSSAIEDVSVTVGVKEEYLDDILFFADEEIDDYLTTLSLGIDGKKESETLQAGVRGLIERVGYADNDDLNNIDQLYVAYADHQTSPKLTIGGEALYKDDSRPDRDVDETGLLLGTDVRITQKYEGRASYELTELSRAAIKYFYKTEDYDELEEDNYNSHNIFVGLNRDLGDWFTGLRGRLDLGFSKYDYTFTDTDNYSLTVGAEKELSELYKLFLNVGVRYSDYEILSQQDLVTTSDNDIGGVVRAGIRYQGEYTISNITFTHDLEPSGGQGRTMERTSLVGLTTYSFSESVKAGMRLGYYLNQGVLDEDPFDETTIRANPNMTFNMTNELRLELSYAYTWSDRRHEDTTRDKNDVFVKLTWDKSLLN